MEGFFDENKRPIIRIKVYGFSRDIKRELQAHVDTGFDGFLSLPLEQALPIGLILNATGSIVLADGSTRSVLLCLGTVILDGEGQAGLVTISSGGTPLVGLEFLDKFNKKLIIDYRNDIVKLE